MITQRPSEPQDYATNSLLDSLELLIETHHVIKEEVLLVINSWTICGILIVGTHCLLVLFF